MNLLVAIEIEIRFFLSQFRVVCFAFHSILWAIFMELNLNSAAHLSIWWVYLHHIDPNVIALIICLFFRLWMMISTLSNTTTFHDSKTDDKQKNIIELI